MVAVDSSVNESVEQLPFAERSLRAEREAMKMRQRKEELSREIERTRLRMAELGMILPMSDSTVSLRSTEPAPVADMAHPQAPAGRAAMIPVRVSRASLVEVAETGAADTAALHAAEPPHTTEPTPAPVTSPVPPAAAAAAAAASPPPAAVVAEAPSAAGLAGDGASTPLSQPPADEQEPHAGTRPPVLMLDAVPRDADEQRGMSSVPKRRREGGLMMAVVLQRRRQQRAVMMRCGRSSPCLSRLSVRAAITVRIASAG
jgi:hypothetical protein